MTREEMFDNAVSESKKEKEKKEERRKGEGWTPVDFEQIEWLGLEDKKDKVFRIVGNPIRARQTGYDPKLINFSKIVDDKGRSCHIIWKSNDDGSVDENWILTKLYDAVNSRLWQKYPNGQKNERGYDGEYVYLHKETPSFKRIERNSKLNEKHPQKFKYRQRILFNVIDRQDDWCQKNNHTKALTSSKNFWKNDDTGSPIFFNDVGVPKLVYDKTLEDVVGFRHHWDLDVVIQKNSSDKNNAYIIRDILEEKISEAAKKIGNAEPLTEVENSYQKYDFDTLFAVTTYSKLRKRLIALFKQVDIDLGTNFEYELEKLVQIELAENKLKGDQTSEADVEEMAVKQESKLEPQAPQKTRRATPPPPPPPLPVNLGSVEELCKKHFPKLDALSKEEQKILFSEISGFKDSVPVWKNAPDILPCSKRGCKYVGTNVDVAFTSLLFTCPVCGTVDTSS